MLAEFLALRIGRGGDMCIGGRMKAQLLLQVDLAGGRIEQISAADNMGDALLSIIYHDCKLICIETVRSLQHKIADHLTEIMTKVSLNRVLKSN